MKQIIVHINQPPYAGSLVAEALDTAMVAAVFEFKVSVLFRGQGVLCLLPQQDGQVIGRKTIDKMLGALPTYDVDQLFVCAASMAKHELAASQLATDVTILQPDQIAALLQQQDAVVGI